MRVQSLIAAGVASIVVISLGAIAVIVGRLGTDPNGGARDVRVALATKPLDRACADCGVVTAVKEVQLKGKDRRVAVQYQIRVRMSDGSVKTLTTDIAPTWKAGDRVRLQNGRLAG
jgi:hypothetical protein